jgi:beta-barrel assembly-enhancing protease
MRDHSWRVRGLAILLAFLLATPDLLQARYKPTSGSVGGVTYEQEIQMGQQAAQQVRRQLPLLPDSSPITQYVQRLGQDLAAHAPGYRWPFNFHVVNQKDINAFALPGGPIFVNLGTIQAADNEAQLAGVIAHEISHVVQRHAMRAAVKEYKAQVGLGILGALLGGGTLGSLARAGIGFGANSYFLKNSRGNESEADLVGTDVMYDTGYDPHAMADFFKKLEGEGDARGSQFFSDHPNPGNRYEAVTRELGTLPGRANYRRDSPEFQNVKRLALGMKPLTAEQIAQQQRESGAGGPISSDVGEPSGSMKTMQHSAYTVQYPSNWQAYGDGNSTVTIAPQGGVGQDPSGQSAIAYGVIIDGFDSENQEDTLDQETHALIQSLQHANPQLRQVGRDEDIRVNGVPAKSADLVGVSPITDSSGARQRERNWLVSMRMGNGSLVYLVFIAPQNDYNRLRPTFEQMLRTFRLNQQ